MKPVKREAVEKYGDKWTLPQNFVGNGAYKLKDWVVNERIVLERSPTYWNNQETVINKATFLPITSEVSDINRYRSGEIDITNSAIPPNLFAKMKKTCHRRFTSVRIFVPSITKLIMKKRHLLTRG